MNTSNGDCFTFCDHTYLVTRQQVTWQVGQLTKFFLQALPPQIKHIKMFLSNFINIVAEYFLWFCWCSDCHHHHLRPTQLHLCTFYQPIKRRCNICCEPEQQTKWWHWSGRRDGCRGWSVTWRCGAGGGE